MNLHNTFLRYLNILAPTSAVASRLQNEYRSLKSKELGIDYLNLCDKEGDGLMFSYLAPNRFDGTVDSWQSPKRQEGKPGRLLGKLLPDIPEKERTSFVNELEALWVKHKASVTVYSGEDIRLYYNGEHHHPDAHRATLGGSCMRSSAKAPYFDCYVGNPEAVSLVVAKRDDLVVARGLLWNAELDGKPVKVLDRVYYGLAKDEILLKEWVKEHIQPHYMRLGDKNTFINCSSGMSQVLSLTVPVKRWRYTLYPYIDTFCYIDKTEGRFQNWKPLGSYRFCQTQEGTYVDSDGDYAPHLEEGEVFIVHLNRVVKQEEAKQYSGAWYLLTEFSTCYLCQAEKPRMNKSAKLPSGEAAMLCHEHVSTVALANGAGTLIAVANYNGKMWAMSCYGCKQFKETLGKSNYYRCADCYSALTTHCTDCQTLMDPDGSCSWIDQKKRVCASCIKNHEACWQCGMYCSLLERFDSRKNSNVKNKGFCSSCINYYFIGAPNSAWVRAGSKVEESVLNDLPVISITLDSLECDWNKTVLSNSTRSTSTVAYPNPTYWTEPDTSCDRCIDDDLLPPF